MLDYDTCLLHRRLSDRFLRNAIGGTVLRNRALTDRIDTDLQQWFVIDILHSRNPSKARSCHASQQKRTATHPVLAGRGSQRLRGPVGAGDGSPSNAGHPNTGQVRPDLDHGPASQPDEGRPAAARRQAATRRCPGEQRDSRAARRDHESRRRLKFMAPPHP